MLSCKETSRLLSESLDRPLPLRTRITLRWHLSMCRLCTRYYRQLRFLRRVMGTLPDHVDQAAPDDCLSQEAKERIKEHLESDR